MTSVEPRPREPVCPAEQRRDGSTYWISSVQREGEQSAEECISVLVGKEHIYALGERTRCRKHLKPGDWICFYATANGVVAHARVRTSPEKRPHPQVLRSDRYPWVFGLQDTKLYLDKPVVVDAALRSSLDAFDGRDPRDPWAWFVFSTHRISEHDFRILTGQGESERA